MSQPENNLPRKKRTLHSHVHDVPKPQHSRAHKKMIIVVGSTMTMIVIAGMYLASFRYRQLSTVEREETPQWIYFKDEVIAETKPFVVEFEELTRSVTAALTANKVRAKGIDILKEKIMSATGTETVDAAQEESTEDHQ